jgi:hypothetical protein
MGNLVLAGATSGSTTITPTDGATATLTLPSTTGTLLTSTGTITTATNLAGGSNGTIPYQSASGTTQMLASGTSGYVLQSNGVGAPSWVAPSSGKVLQIVSTNKSGLTYTVSSAYSSTGVFATITPTSATSKIIMIASSGQVYSQSGGLRIRLYRGTSGEGSGSSIQSALGFCNITTPDGYLGGTVNYVDSPASTSALTYTIMQSSENGSSLVAFVNTSNASMILMEIAP